MFNKLLLTTSYDGNIDNLSTDILRNATENVDFMHISIYDYDSLDLQYNNCKSHASIISEHLTKLTISVMKNESLSLPFTKRVKLNKIVLEQRFVGFDINIPSRHCAPLNYNQICGILNERQTEWNTSYPRYRRDWFQAMNQNNTRALMLESKQWLVFQIHASLAMCLFDSEDTSLGGFIVSLNTDDYSGKCNLKEYAYLYEYYFDTTKYPLQLPINPTFPLLKTIRSTIDAYFKLKPIVYMW